MEKLRAKRGTFKAWKPPGAYLLGAQMICEIVCVHQEKYDKTPQGTYVRSSFLSTAQ